MAPTSQFGRAVRKLGVELIAAHSPQAKGRIERLFHTLQDRLVKEMRLAGIATLAEANRFLPPWLARYNRRFAVPPAHTTDLHRPLPAGTDVRAVLALKTRRVLRRDWTVAHGGQLYRLQASHVVIEERVDGTLRILYQDRPLTYQPILHRPRPVMAPRPARRPRALVKPPATHPWNRFGTFARARPREATRCTGHLYCGRKRTFLKWVDRQTALPCPSMWPKVSCVPSLVNRLPVTRSARHSR